MFNDLFIDNKYTKWYISIIQNAEVRILQDIYYEKHHIIPKSLGGENDKNNLVKLTAKEHFICHKLLVKMLTGKNKAKMYFALSRFLYINPLYNREINLTSKDISSIRENASKAISLFHKGKTVSEEAKRKVSLANTGKQRTPEQKTNISNNSKLMWVNNRNKMMDSFTPEARQKMSDAKRGKKQTEEWCKGLSERTQGNKNPRATKIQIVSPDNEIFICFGNFQLFCKEHDLPYSTMNHILHKTREFNKGKCVGWQADYLI
jgi:hypothetical protein